MRKIFTSLILNKKAYGPSVDDQPNFVNRDNQQQGEAIFLNNNDPASEKEIKKRWKKNKKNRCKIVEEMPKGSL